MQQAAIPKLSAIPTRQHATLVYYHKWKGFECREICGCLRAFTVKSLQKIKTGTLVWVDTDPMYHHGKVYGWVLRRIQRVEDRGDGKFWVEHSGGGCLIDGTKPKQHKFYYVSAPVRLENLLRANPKATAPV